MLPRIVLRATAVLLTSGVGILVIVVATLAPASPGLRLSVGLIGHAILGLAFGAVVVEAVRVKRP